MEPNEATIGALNELISCIEAHRKSGDIDVLGVIMSFCVQMMARTDVYSRGLLVAAITSYQLKMQEKTFTSPDEFHEFLKQIESNVPEVDLPAVEAEIEEAEIE